MKALEATKTPITNPMQNLFSLLRGKLGGRNGLIAVAVLAVGGGLYLNWGWLAAAGLAPLILGILPCAAMCALGLCANKLQGGKSSCSSSETPSKAAGTSEPSATKESQSIVIDPAGAGVRAHESVSSEQAKS